MERYIIKSTPKRITINVGFSVNEQQRREKMRRKEEALDALFEWREKLDREKDEHLFDILSVKISSLLTFLKFNPYP